MKILITGGSGFLGKNLIKDFSMKNYEIVSSVRKDKYKDSKKITFVNLGDINNKTDWGILLRNCEVVIHTSGLSHDSGSNPEESRKIFTKTNIEATSNLFQQAIRFGVKKFIFLSSAKVFGENTNNDLRFNELDPANPQDIYSWSKHVAENEILSYGKNKQIDIFIIRAPIIYGPGVKNNFSDLIHYVRNFIIFPCFTRKNKRSYLALDNLIDFINICVERQTHAKKLQEIFAVSDIESLSTCEVIKKIQNAYKVKNALIYIPDFMISYFAKIFFAKKIRNRIFGNFQIDIDKAARVLGWKPKYTMSDQLKKMVDFDD